MDIWGVALPPHLRDCPLRSGAWGHRCGHSELRPWRPRAHSRAQSFRGRGPVTAVHQPSPSQILSGPSTALGSNYLDCGSGTTRGTDLGLAPSMTREGGLLTELALGQGAEGQHADQHQDADHPGLHAARNLPLCSGETTSRGWDPEQALRFMGRLYLPKECWVTFA